MGASDLASRSAYELSGGQRRAVAIATVLAMEPSILVLDEPTSSLDTTARHRVIDIIRGFSHTVLIATHDLDMARELCPRSLLMSKGRIIADAPTEDILTDTGLLARAGMIL